MSIKLLKDESISNIVGTSSADSLIIPKNRKSNFATVKLAYISNTSTNTWHSNISIYATSTSAIDVTNGSNGYGVKLYSGSLEPSNEFWDNLNYNNKVRINNIGTDGTADNNYYPLYIYTDVPSNSEIGIHRFQIVINSMEHSI